METVLHFALLGPAAAALLTSGLAHWRGWSYFHWTESLPESESLEAHREKHGSAEEASIIVPLLDAGPQAEACLKALLAQRNLEAFEVIVATRSAEGPEANLTESLSSDYDQLRLVTTEGNFSGSNDKIRNLRAGVEAARFDTFVFVDADASPEPTQVQEAAASLSADETDLVYAAPIGTGAPTLPAAIENFFVNDSAMTYAAQADQGSQWGAVGALMAVRHETLENLGGLAPFADQIALDVALGKEVLRKDLGIYLMRRPVPVLIGEETWTSVGQRLHRWLVTMRAYFPSFPFFTAGLALPMAWTLGFLGLSVIRGAHVGVGLAALGMVWTWKIGSQALIAARLPAGDGLFGKKLWPRLWLLLGSELFWLGTFIWSLLSRQVHWGGRVLEVHLGGAAQVVKERSDC